MGLNGLGPKKLRQLARLTGLDNIVRATTYSHADYWRVWLTLKPHQHAVYNYRSCVTIVEAGGRSDQCTSLCRQLFPEDFNETN